MVLAARAVPPEVAAAGAGLLPAAAGVLPEVVELLLELAHADTAMARAASPATPQIFLIRIFSLSQCK